MLVEFSVGNYRSFRETVTFSMVAASLKARDDVLNKSNVFEVENKLSLLKSAAIYGANASGKSNLARALNFMRWFIVNSSRETQSTDKIDVEPFRLSTETYEEASLFEIIFYMDNRRYRYGFEVNQAEVVSEWLFYVPNIRETLLFERDNNSIKSTNVYGAEGIQNKTRNNALFLSVSAQFSVDLAERILEWVTEKLNIISGIDSSPYFGYTLNSFLKGENKDRIIQLVKRLDLGISDIQTEQKDFSTDNLPQNMPDELKELIIKASGGKGVSVSTIHKKYDGEGNYNADEEFYLDRHESEGTKKLFALSGPIFTTLAKGEVLIVDELDARLHPLISRVITSLFNSNETNPKNAQLVFMTHDTNLLSNKLFRRDQVWFIEKDGLGGSALYSLAEFKVRNDASFESDYIKGRYGAIPYIGNVSSLFLENGKTEEEPEIEA